MTYPVEEVDVVSVVLELALELEQVELPLLEAHSSG